jgi:hypothetical protein
MLAPKSRYLKTRRIEAAAGFCYLAVADSASFPRPFQVAPVAFRVVFAGGKRAFDAVNNPGGDRQPIVQGVVIRT